MSHLPDLMDDGQEQDQGHGSGIAGLGSEDLGANMMEEGGQCVFSS